MPIFTFVLWLLLVWVSGWLALPIMRRLCGHALPDGGLALGRIAFLTVWGLLAFWLGHIKVPVGVSAVLYLPLAGVGIWRWMRDKSALQSDLRKRQNAIISVEAVFLSIFLVFFALRGYWSDTNGNNGEKSMDSALIGTLLRAQSLPPENPYSAGARLNSYYIFGHLETALLTKSVGTTGRWSYNLMCATLPALCFSALFSLGAGLTRRLDGGLFVSSTILGLGTLQPLFQWFRPQGVDPYPLLRLDPSPIKNLDFFAASRPLPFAINEFPWFTFNQSDLHAHYFDFPIEIALMCLAWAIFRGPNERRRFVLLGVAALFLGAQILTNTWDFPAYTLGVALAFFLSPRSREHKGIAQLNALAHRARKLGEEGVAKVSFAATNTTMRRVLAFGVTIVVSLLLASPYLLGINTAARGPSPLPQPASPLREWLLLWGPIAVAWSAFCAWVTFRFDARWRWALGGLALFVLVAAIWGQGSWGYPEGLNDNPPNGEAARAWFGLLNPARLVLPLIVWFAFLSAISAYYNRGVARFLPCLALAGLFAVLWSETTWAGFLGDPLNPVFGDYKRQDTVFKFGLQGWFLWGTAASAGAYLALSRWPLALRLAFIPFLWVMAVSSVVDTMGRTQGPDPVTGQKLQPFDAQHRQNWDAWGHMTAGEKDAATWLQAHTGPEENILEAEEKEGGDYSIYSRYTHATGIATIIGPQAHSFQWSPNPIRLTRDYDKDGQPLQLRDENGRPVREDGEHFLGRKIDSQWTEVNKRKADARAAFTTSNANERLKILRSYNVRYVMWGELEREQYGEGAHDLLVRDLGKPVATFGASPGDDLKHKVEIFQVP